MIDTSRVNAQTIYCVVNGYDPRNYDSSDFSEELGMALVLPFMRTRANTPGLQSHIKTKMAVHLPSPPVDNSASMVAATFPFPSVTEGPKKRCKQCCLNIYGPGQKQTKDKLQKLLTQCQMCESPICKAHMYMTCVSCSKNLTVFKEASIPDDEIN